MHFAPIRPDVTARLATVGQQMLPVAIGSADPQSPFCQAVIHHLGRPGLRVRSQIALHAADCMTVDGQSALAMETCCELLLSPAFEAQADVTDIATMPRLVAQTHAAVAQIIRGQASPALPPHADFDRLASYQAMAAAKSGPLLSLPIGLVFSYRNRPDLVATSARVVHALSITYQIANDLADFDADKRAVLEAALIIIGVLKTADDTDRASALAHAVLMARPKLAEALAIAAELPHGTAAILPDLAARITYKLDGYQ